MADVLKELGYLALGSRLKRVAERLQADANRVHESFGYVTQSGHFPLLAALYLHGDMTVSQAAASIKAQQPAVTRTASSLVKLKLVVIDTPDNDRRQRRLALTDVGRAYVSAMETQMWPGVERAARSMCGGANAVLLQEIEKLEAALDQRSLLKRAGLPFRLVPYRPELSEEFYAINAAWIREMFVLEPHDEAVLRDPQTHILDRGGDVLFVEWVETSEIVGTCALMPDPDGAFELTKMGVKASMRGKKAGEYLLQQAIQRGESLGAAPLYLLTNKKCEAAIHLYEKLGFEHDPVLLEARGSRYERCDVAMRYAP